MSCHSGIDLVDYFYLHLGTIALGAATITWLLHMAFYRIKKYPLTLKANIAKIASGFALPSAAAMLIASFDPPDLLGCVSNLGLYIFIGSVSVIWLAWTVLFPEGKEKPPQ